MNRSGSLFGAALSFIGSLNPALPETQTVSGQLVDIGNYAEGHGPAEYGGVHGRACALEGFEVGLLTSDGKLYHVTGDMAAHANAKLLPHFLAKSVTINGEVTEKDGQTMLNATDIK